MGLSLQFIFGVLLKEITFKIIDFKNAPRLVEVNISITIKF